jgi:hypothetical protein
VLQIADDPLARYLASSNPNPPPRLGIRYDAEGRFLAEPGNTIVCHLVSGSLSESVLQAVRRQMMSMPGAECLAFTPESSLHMTLFQGIIDSRREPVYWPAGVSLQKPVPDLTRLMMSRLDGFDGPGPFRIRPVALKPTGITVAGLTEDDDACLAAWRDALADRLGYRHPDHDRYSFHITFAYPIRGIPDQFAEPWRRFMAAGFERLAGEASIIELAPPAFCRFKDMTRFEELLVLA